MVTCSPPCATPSQGRDITYKFKDLAPGSYKVYAGYGDPWAQWDDRGAKVTVNGKVVEADHDYSPENQTAAYENVVVGSDGTLTFNLSRSRNPDVQLSWLMVAGEVPAAPVLKLAATATSKCVAGKHVLTVQAVNNDSVPVQLTFTSAFGDQAFANVLPGKNAVQAISTRAAELAAGSATVAATASVNGAPVSVSVNAAYGAASCK